MAFTLTEMAREETARNDGFMIVRTLLCQPYSARGEVYDALLGGVQYTGGKLVRILPAGDPVFPWARVKEINTVSLDDDYLVGLAGSPLTIAAQYANGAVLKVTYEVPDYGQGNSPTEQELASEQTDFSARNLTLPSDRYAWDKTGEPTANPKDTGTELLQFQGLQATKRVPQIEYSLMRHFVPYLPYTTISQMLGRINRNAFVIFNRTYRAETLRFDSYHSSRRLTNQGVPYYDVTYRFAIFPLWDRIFIPPDRSAFGVVGWNRLYNASKGYWQRVKLFSSPTQQIYDYDTSALVSQANVRLDQIDPNGPNTTTAGPGFALLFDPKAT